MIKCAKCRASAKYKAVKRFHVFPIAPLYLCEEHRKGFDNIQDVILIGLLAMSLILAVAGMPYRRIGAPASAAGGAAESATPPAFDPRDLDQDGFVSWWEEHITGEQLLNFSKVGYPFEQILHMGEPTKSVKKRIEIGAFGEALKSTTETGAPWSNFFHHPKLMERFFAKYTNPDSPVQIRGVYLTHDLYLAILLIDDKDDTRNAICLEKLSPSDEAILAKLAGEVKDTKNVKKKPAGKGGAG
jgi:hypothetical protein